MTRKDRIIGWTATGIVCAVMVFFYGRYGLPH